MREFQGKTAVVTGGGSGMGEGMAHALAHEGCNVIVADIMKDNAEAVAAQIKASGGQAVGIACDVSDRASVRSLKADANRMFGPVALVCANAGVTLFEPLVDMTDEDVDWILQVNLHGVMHCVQAFLPDMIAAREGHIVATSSLAGLLSPIIGDHAPYIAAKAGVIGMMLSIRHELAGTGVGMTVLCPGKVATQITESRKYRPTRFGGPAQGAVTLPHDAETQTERTPDQVAQIVLRGIRENRPLLVTHSNAKDVFLKTYADMVAAAFDDVAEWEKELA